MNDKGWKEEMVFFYSYVYDFFSIHLFHAIYNYVFKNDIFNELWLTILFLDKHIYK